MIIQSFEGGIDLSLTQNNMTNTATNSTPALDVSGASQNLCVCVSSFIVRVRLRLDSIEHWNTSFSSSFSLYAIPLKSMESGLVLGEHLLVGIASRVPMIPSGVLRHVVVGHHGWRLGGHVPRIGGRC